MGDEIVGHDAAGVQDHQLQELLQKTAGGAQEGMLGHLEMRQKTAGGAQEGMLGHLEKMRSPGRDARSPGDEGNKSTFKMNMK